MYHKCFATIVFSALLLFASTAYAWNREDIDSPELQAAAERAVQLLGDGKGALALKPEIYAIPGLSLDLKSSGSNLVATSTPLAQAISDLKAEQTDFGWRVSLNADVLFDFDKSDIRKDAEDSLKKLAIVIREKGKKQVAIYGYTDAKGSDSYNQNLSEKRAESVKAWLVDNEKVSADLLHTKGYGETNPVADNTNPDGSDNPEGRTRNRRVEILIQ